MLKSPRRQRGKVLRRWSEIILGIPFTVVLGPVSFGMAVMGVPEDETFGDFLGVLGVEAVILWFIGAIPTSKVVLRADGMRVDNWFTSYWVPWSSVSHVDAEYSAIVVLNDGTEVELGIGGGSVLNLLRGNRCQNNLRDKIEQLRAAAVSADASSGDSVMVRKGRPGIARLMGWLVLFFGTAALMGHLF